MNKENFDRLLSETIAAKKKPNETSSPEKFSGQKDSSPNPEPDEDYRDEEEDLSYE